MKCKAILDKLNNRILRSNSIMYTCSFVSGNASFGRDNKSQFSNWTHLMLAKLASGSEHGVSIVVRQFNHKEKTTKGLPKKKICMCFLSLDGIIQLSAKEAESIHCTDLNSSKPLPIEDGVSFVDFEEWINR
jgi:hypothetical protein